MNFQTRTLIGSLFLAGLCSAAQAAYFERVDYLGAGGYSAQTQGDLVSSAAVDLSAPTGDVALFGAQIFSSTLTNGALEHSYAADAFLNFSTSGTDLSMSLSQSLTATASGGTLTVADHQQESFMDLTAVTLRIVGQPSEAGSLIRVSFFGDASAIYDLNSMVNSDYLGLGLSISQGNSVAGDYLWDVTQSGDQQVSFSFTGHVGDEFTLSSYILSGASLTDVQFAPSSAPYQLVDAGAALNGSFTMAPVPLPETSILLLSSLGLMGASLRRCKAA